MTTLSPTTSFPSLRGLRGSTLTLLGGLLLTTLVLLGIGVYSFVYFTEQSSWQGRQAEATKNASNQVTAFLNSADSVLRMVDRLSTIPAVAERDQMTVALEELLQQNSAIQELLLLDESGQLLATASQDRAVLANVFTIPQSIWFLEARSGSPYLSDLEFSSDNRAYVILARPTQNNGVVAALLRMDVLRDVVAEVRFGTSGRAYLINAAGQILSHTDFDIVLENTNIDDRSELTQMRMAPNYNWAGNYTNFENETVVGTSEGVSTTNWILVTEVAQSEAFATSRTALLLLGGITTLFWVGALAFSSSFLQRLIFAPLDKLRLGAERVENGDLDYRVPASRDDEIGTVTHSFNEMVNRVNERTQATNTLYQISQALTHARSPEDIARAIVEALPSESPNSCRLFSVQLNGATLVDSLELVAEWRNGDLPALTPFTRYKVSDYPFTKLLLAESQETQFIEDVATDQRLDEATRQTFLSLRNDTTAVIPFAQGGRWTGVMTRSWQGTHPFSDAESTVYRALPSLIAPVVYNLELVENLENNVEALRTARAAAEESSQLKSEFLSTVSHELRTPLNAIEGYTGIMASGLGGFTLEPKVQRMVERVRLNSRRLLGLVNDFLDLSRIESGRVELVNIPFSPARLVARWESEMAILADSKGIKFTASIDPSLPPTILGDEDALSKVVLNLLSNAIKFTEKGEVSLRIFNQDATWSIEVEDTGIGIPSSAHGYIFDEFRQVDGSSTRKFGGTGLGLAIVQKLVRLMNGKVQLQSEVGVGSVFTIQLPLHHHLVAIPQEL